MGDELAALAVLEGGGNADLDAELVRLVSLALADAFHFGSMQAVDLGAALPAFLLAHPPAKAEQVSEAALEPMVAIDLAGNVADDAAEIGLERAQSPVGALELLGMGVTLMLDQGELADPRIGLPELHAQLFGQLHQLLTGPVHQLGVGREGNVLRLHRGVDNDARELRRLHGTSLGCYRQALLQQRLQPLLSHAVAPVVHRGSIERQPVLEKLLAAKVLVIRILDPLLAHHLVAEIIGVLENREPRHQPGRQRRPPGAIGIYGTELPFQKPPLDRPRQLRQPRIHVTDLGSPETKQILLAAFPPLPWPHRTLRKSPLWGENPR